MTKIDQVGAAAAISNRTAEVGAIIIIITINSEEVVEITITTNRTMKMGKTVPTKKKERAIKVATAIISAKITGSNSSSRRTRARREERQLMEIGRAAARTAATTP